MRNARNQRGLTLIEVMVGTVIALLLTAAAVAFATQETRLMDVSQERLEMSMVGRSALGLLAADLRKAGAGVGYDEQGRFLGLLADDFNAGGVPWNGQGAPVGRDASPPFNLGAHFVNDFTRSGAGPNAGTTYSVPTHDIGIQYADGSFATIVSERNDAGIMCAGPDIEFESGELVLMRDAIGISARSGTIELTPFAGGANCPCQGGCANFVLTPTTDLSTGVGAANASFGYGEIQGGLTTVVWFVAEEGGEGQLRRVEFPGGACGADRSTCGGLVADEVEALLSQIWYFDGAGGGWRQAGQAAFDTREARMRVDVELIMRTNSETKAYQPQLESKIADDVCIPDACGSTDLDRYERVAYRTSVEIMNSGVMAVQ